MLFSTSTTSLSLSLTTALLLSTTSHAARTRPTNCHCTILADAPPPAQITPSTAHWTPSDPSPHSHSPDLCAALGPKLDEFRHSEPDIFNAYIHQLQSNQNADSARPIPTTVLLAFAARRGNGGAGSGISWSRNSWSRRSRSRSSRITTTEEAQDDAVSRDISESQPRGRIVCRPSTSTTSTFTTAPDQTEPYQETSLLNLWVLQIIIAVAILACAAEGVHLGMRWISHRNTPNSNSNSNPNLPPTNPSSHTLRLPGPEKRLLAIPPTNPTQDILSSPGSDKKTRAYETMRFFVTQARSGRREFIAYEDDEDDDEAGRPVM